eukprot:CAMPEP_0202346946 /NCGR_PEP_ID=MMETSP1126-20121109/5518_1 /ASSEMBLY_ACC=CAM_ASM_000457 /TAXON_ID=3047 /ORGANISM="Dunaliella tertiolecta, Strain CCMP1320" /LENGTH=747 /DNA_ID=CAMNT_0048938425 /DNA_START=160 /DNA_END=2400 /DNA_ORIENTATION=+
MQKEQLKQNGHVNGVMENGPMRQEESPFVDASETMQGSAPSVSEQLPQPGQDTQEYQRLSSPRLSSPGVSSSGVRPSRLSQMSPASAANAPGSQTNAKFAKGSRSLYSGTPSSKSRRGQAPSIFRVLYACIMEVVENFQGMYNWVCYAVGKIKKREPFNVQLPYLMQFLLWSFAISNLFMVKILKPKPWWLAVFVFQGMVLGLGASFWYYFNKKRKAEICGVLGSNLGLKGLNFLLGGLPSWISYTEKEKVQWLNRTLEEVWPFYDQGLSKMIKAMVEDMFRQTLKVQKIPGVKGISFKYLTFGDAPFRVDSIEVNDHHGKEKALVMEVEMRWCGQANIALAIDFEPPVPFTKICPAVEDITFSGALRIVLQPLVDDIPGFGAAMVTFRKPPSFSYSLGFSKMILGEQIGTWITTFVNKIIRNQMVNMLVWPQRLVVPILNTPQMEYEMERLSFRAQGIMKVHVIQARGLPVADIVGTSDAFVELTTDGKHVVSTPVIPDNVNPVWNYTHYLLVHEPTREHMKVEVHDHDAFSPLDLLKLNFKEVLEAKELLGRCLVNLKPITEWCKENDSPYECWYDLGKGEWNKVGGCGHGRGQLQLSCMYRPFTSIQPLNPSSVVPGILIFKIIHAHRLPRAIRAGQTMTVNAEVRCDKQREMVTAVTSADDHHWNNLNSAHFHGIKSTSECTVVVQDNTTGDDEFVGSIDVKVQDVLKCQDLSPLSGTPEANFMARSFKLKRLRSNPGHASGW